MYLRQIFFIFILSIILSLSTSINFVFAGSAEGMCPLPASYKVSVNNSEIENDIPARFKSKASLAVVMWYVSDESFESVKPIKVEEDSEKKYKFIATSATGTKALPKDFSKEDFDTSTGKDYINWMPSPEIYHNPEWDISKCGQEMYKYPCYKFLGFENPSEGYKWKFEKGEGWMIEEIGFAYHMDSPNLMGYFGNMGANPDESVEKKGMDEFSFKYYVPSVPAWYSISSVLTLKWSWPHKYYHVWEVNHKGGGEGAAKNKCKGCDLDLDKALVEEQENQWPTPVKYETQPKYCKLNANDEQSSYDVTKNWPAQYFYSKSNDGEGKINDPTVADKRTDNNGLDVYGLAKGLKIYSNPVIDYEPKDSASRVARINVYVTDKENIAHIQTGFADECKNTVAAECGKTISSVCSDKNLTIRIVDNNPWACKYIMEGFGNIPERKETEWNEKNFKVRFWYEVPLYQYASYTADKWQDASGIETPIIETVYSPMFVWKKVEWNSLKEFLFDGTDTKNLSYDYNQKEADGPPVDPAYTIYEKNIPLSKLFIDSKNNVEEIMQFHYATTSLGDPLGNPPYSGDLSNDQKDIEFTDNSNTPVINKFAYKPLIFTKGKGALKYFAEAHDGSLKTNGGGNEETKFNCGASGENEKNNKPYFTEDNYLQGQLKFNPESVKYMVSSKDADEMSASDPKDPTIAGTYCSSVPYDSAVQKIWIQCPKLLKNINSNVDDGETVVKYFQAWGHIEPIDVQKPNVGLKIIDLNSGSQRIVTLTNDYQTFSFYKDLVDGANKKWSTIDQKIKFSYPLFEKTLPPRPPFSDEQDLWAFQDLELLLKFSPHKKLYEGRSYAISSSTVEDSLDPYGTVEDTPLEMTHQDLMEEGKKATLAFYYAHDNIDGQRIIKSGSNVIKEKSWYKGVEAIDFETAKDIKNVFVTDTIGKGYTSWKITDQTFRDYLNNPTFKKIYMKDDYFKYPRIYFNNPNRNLDGTQIIETDPEISVVYAVADRAGNTRKFKLYLYVAPIETKINVIERKN